MALEEGQWQIRDLVIGPYTRFRLMDTSDPWDLSTRADQGGPRAWNHGSWSGAEWANGRVVPIRLLVRDESDLTVAGWRAARNELAAAFAPVGDATGQVELRFLVGGVEHVLFGRPRMVEFETQHQAAGYTFVRAAFVAQDPRIYAGTESEDSTGLTQFAGGLLVPLIVPFTVDGTLSSGAVDLTNVGTASAGMTMRIDGPVDRPRLVLQDPDGATSELLFEVTLGSGQWLDVDTVSKTALLNGLPSSNQFGRAVWGWGQFPLAPGASTLRFFAEAFQSSAQVTATYRSAWW